MLLHIYTLIGHHSVSWAVPDGKGPRCRLEIDHESVGSISNRRRPDCLCYLCYGVSNQRLNCLFNTLFMKTSKLRITYDTGNLSVRWIPLTKSQNSENICLSWRHHWTTRFIWCVRPLDTITLRFESLLTWWYTCSLQWRLVTVAVSQSPATGLSFTGWHQRKYQKVHITGLCEGNTPVTGGFPSQRTSNTENTFMWWRHPSIKNTPLWATGQCVENYIY